MENLYIVIPAYNEQETIQSVIEQWYPVVSQIGADSRLVIVNDGSKDNTYEIMLECTKNRPQLIPLSKENSGHGATLLYAYHYALEHEANYVFQTDSDGQTLADEFWSFWEQRKEFDMIIGYRNQRKDGISRIFVTRVLKLVIKICFGEKITDANTPFRLMEGKILKQNLYLVPENFNLSNVILSVIYAKKKLKVKYIPITFRPRQGGVNSINLKKITRIGIQAVKDFKKINKTLRKIEIDV